MDKFGVFLTAVMAILLGYCIGTVEAKLDRRELEADIVGAPVRSLVCYDTGCSVLVQHADKSREWLWLPKLVTDK